MQQRTYKTGDVILEEGEPSDSVYRIVSGEAEVYTQGDGHPIVLGNVKAGEFLGEMGVIEGKPRSASARAKGQLTATRLEKWEFLRLMSEEPSSAYRLIARLGERLRVVNRKLAEATASKEAFAHTEPPAIPQPDGEGLTTQAKTTSGAAKANVTLYSSSQQLSSYIPAEGLRLSKLPFTVGRAPSSGESGPSVPIDLIIPDSKPYRLSRQHFSVSRLRDGYVVLDIGSTLGTEVNGEFLGEHFGADFIPLKQGDNVIVAGGAGSPFTFKVFLKET